MEEIIQDLRNNIELDLETLQKDEKLLEELEMALESNQKVMIFINNQLRWKSSSNTNRVQEFIKNILPDVPNVEISGSVLDTLKNHHYLIKHFIKEMQTLVKQ